MEARDKRGGSTRRCVASRADVPRMFFFVVCYYEADYAYSHYQYHEDSDTNWGSRRDVSRAPSTCKFYLFQYTYVLLTSIYRQTTNWGSRRDVAATCKFYLFQYTYVLLTSIYRQTTAITITTSGGGSSMSGGSLETLEDDEPVEKKAQEICLLRRR